MSSIVNYNRREFLTALLGVGFMISLPIMADESTPLFKKWNKPVLKEGELLSPASVVTLKESQLSAMLEIPRSIALRLNLQGDLESYLSKLSGDLEKKSGLMPSYGAEYILFCDLFNDFDRDMLRLLTIEGYAKNSLFEHLQSKVVDEILKHSASGFFASALGFENAIGLIKAPYYSNGAYKRLTRRSKL